MAENSERLTAEIERVALGRVGEIADSVAFLASPSGSFISGADLLFDRGGQHNVNAAKLRDLRSL